MTLKEFQSDLEARLAAMSARQELFKHCRELQAESEAMRMAIKEAHVALTVIAGCDLAFDESKLVDSALANLKPFLKP